MEDTGDSASERTTFIPRADSEESEAGLESAFAEWDRYQVLDCLGTGATSRVYRAVDPSLNRRVALKFILGSDPSTEKRFVREARAQAQIDHSHVCKIFEVGTFAGKHYIAMQLIDGEMLTKAAQKMTLEQKVLVMHQVSEAIQEAHKKGVIHRDIKPSNIMLEKTDSGWHSYVLDFGLARETAVEGITMTGLILGTPSFMSPEQAWGDLQKVDRRSDIYSLGATMYSILAGRAPFEGTSMEVIFKLAHEDPVPLRKIAPQIPIDLETIVMKCMEREPHRRYDSAKALAEDLYRYMNGDSIQARAATWSYKFGKKLRKHKAVSITLATSALLVLLLGGAGIYSWWHARTQIRTAREFVQAAENVEWRMRVARMAPLHNLSEEKEQVEKKMSYLRQRMTEVGSLAEGPGNYALGRGSMELDDYDEAKAQLEKAWNAGYQPPESAYALGLTLGHLYQRELESAQQIESPKQKERKIKEIETTYRNPALNFLRRSQAAEPAIDEYLKGLIAFYEKKYPVALQRAEAARKKTRWLHEASILEGDIHMAMGIEHFERGNHEDAMKEYSIAGKAFQDAMKVARSDTFLYESDCWRWLQVMVVEDSKGGLQQESMTQGLSACDLALQANPDSAIAYSRKAQIWWRWGEDQYYEGKYSKEAVDKSIEFARAAVRINSEDLHSHFELGNAFGLKAENEQASGSDPTVSWDQAIEYYKTAAAIQPRYSNIYNNLAIAYLGLAQYDIEKGRDPRSKLNEAIANCRKAVQLTPDSLGANNTIGTTYIVLAEYESRHGINPQKSIEQSMGGLDRAHQISPQHPAPYMNLATVHADLAMNQLNRGLNPVEASQRAIEYSHKALELGGDGYATVYAIIGTALLIQTKYKILQGKPPGELLLSPIEYSKKTLESGSNETTLAYDNLLDTYYTAAEYSISQGRDPSEMLNKARAIQQKAISDIVDSDLEFWGATLEILAARWNLRQNRSPELELQKALSIVNKATEIDPNVGSFYSGLAEISEIRAEWFLRQGKPTQEAISESRKNVQKSLELNPSLADAWALQGKLNWIQAQTESDPAKQAESIRLARESLQKTFDMNSNLKRKYLSFSESLSQGQ